MKQPTRRGRLRRTNLGAVRVGLALFVAAVLACGSGCARRSALVDYVPWAEIGTPSPDRAVIVFLRPSSLGYLISAAVYEDDQFLGIVMRNTYVIQSTTPGRHMYMVVSEAADFMSADLEGGKIYFATVVPRMGWWRARFSLEPVTPSSPSWAQLDGWLRDSQRAILNEEGRQWARDNLESVLGKKAGDLPKWEGKADQPHLRPQDGVSRF